MVIVSKGKWRSAGKSSDTALGLAMKQKSTVAPSLRPKRPSSAVSAEPARAVGVLGLGIIGSRVADACRRAGLEVVAWNRTPRSGQAALATPGEVARAARVLQIFVTDDAALGSVVEALVPALTEHHVVLNCSTVSLDATRGAASAVAATGAAFLDAPFTGSKNAAAAGELVYYIGGPAAVLERVRWVLEPSAKAIIPLGGVGDATVIKIATNLVSAIAVEALSEALGVVTAHGVGAEQFLAAMEHNANSSGLSRMKLPGMVAGAFEPHFSLKNMWKDAGFAERLAQAAGLEIPALTVARTRMGALVGQGRGEEDFSVLAVNYAGPGKPNQA
jgi:3-hydroxyisobutyrate dehydrogenase